MENDKIIGLNVGGQIFRTTRSTINNYSNSFLAKLITYDSIKDENGNYFIDRDPNYFSYVLEYFRNGDNILNDYNDYLNNYTLAKIKRELDFFNLPYQSNNKTKKQSIISLISNGISIKKENNEVFIELYYERDMGIKYDLLIINHKYKTCSFYHGHRKSARVSKILDNLTSLNKTILQSKRFSHLNDVRQNIFNDAKDLHQYSINSIDLKEIAYSLLSEIRTDTFHIETEKNMIEELRNNIQYAKVHI